MESLTQLYRIGPGPSSSHTLAVRNACMHYQKFFGNYQMFLVELCGSLALTGKGHMSDKVIIDTFGSDHVIIRMNEQMYKNQPNTMIFYTIVDNMLTNKMVIFSTGGGAIEVEGMPSIVDKNVYPQKNFEEIKQFCLDKHLNLSQYVYYYEPQIKSYLNTVLQQMILSCRAGLNKEGFLPGSLHIEKIAKSIYRKALDCSENDIRDKLMISAFAYSSMEQNASGEIVVTAPTLGSCGVVSSLVNFYYQNGIAKDILINALAAAGVIGNIIKTNASISGAIGGCQAEVGTACAMGATFACYVEQLNINQTEMAAEIAIEHHLGLTCDPVGGYVQIPCIERNGQAALRSIDAMIYAKYFNELKENKVSFDKVVEVMNLTGQKIAMELRETSLGGLAEVIPTKSQIIDN